MKKLKSLFGSGPGLLILLLVLYLYLVGFQKHGIGISPDSTSYILSAESFLRSLSFYETEKQPLVEWPFFYPLVLSFLKLVTGLSWEQVALLLNLTCLTLNYLLWIRFFRMVFPETESSVWFEVAYFGFPTLYVYAFAWSEPLFNLFFVAFLIVFVRYLKEPDIRKTLIMSLLSTLMVLTRYAGLFVVAGAFISLFLFWLKKGSWRKGLAESFAYGFMPLVAIAAWFYRNLKLTGTLAGPRNPLPIYSYGENLYNFVDQISSWFFPHKLPAFVSLHISGKAEELYLPLIPRLAVLVLLAFILLYFAVLRKGESGAAAIQAGDLGLAYLIPLVYTLFILFTSTRVYFETNRFLSPVYPLFMMLVWMLLSRFLKSVCAHYAKGICALAAFLILAHSIYFPVSSYLRIIKEYNESGLGVKSTEFRSFVSSVIEFKRLNEPAEVVTDNPSILEYLVRFENMEELRKVKDESLHRLIILFKPHSSVEDYLRQGESITKPFEIEGTRVLFVRKSGCARP